MIANPVAYTGLQTLLFFLASIALFFIPGAFFVRLSKLKVAPCERFSLSWALGYLLSTGFFFVVTSWKLEFVFYIAIIAVNLGYFASELKKDREMFLAVRSWGRWEYGFVLLFVLGSAVYWFMSSHWIEFDNQGLRFYYDFYGDNLLGTSFAAEMKHTVPPENPSFAGQYSLYQYFPYIGLTIFSKILHLPLQVLSYFHLLVLSWMILYTSILSATRRFFKSRVAQVIVLIFTMSMGAATAKIGYAVSFSYFLCGLLLLDQWVKKFDRSAFAWSLLLWAALASSLSLLSFMTMPAMVLFCLLAWKGRHANRWPLTSFSILFLGSTVLVSLLFFGLPSRNRATPPALEFKNHVQQHIRNTIMEFDGQLYEHWRKQYKQLPRHAWQLVTQQSHLMRYAFLLGIWLAGLITLAFTVLQLGFFGFIEAIRWLREKTKWESPGWTFLAILGITGIVIPFVVSPTNASISPIVFFSFSGFILTFFAAQFIDKKFRRSGSLLFKIIVLAAGIHFFSRYALANVVQFKNTLIYYTQTSYDLLNAYNFLKKQTLPEETVMHHLINEKVYSIEDPSKDWVYPEHNYYFPIMTERRSVYITPVLGTSLRKARIDIPKEERLADLETFYSTKHWAVAEAILKKYKIRWILVTQETPLHFPFQGKLQIVLQNQSVKVLKFLTEF